MFAQTPLDGSPAVLLDAVESNRGGFLARLGRIAAPELPGGSQAEQYRTGVPSSAFNGVSRLDAPERFVEPSVDALVRWWRTTGLPWSFWISDREQREAVPEILVSYGLDRREHLLGLGIDPREGREPGPATPGLLVQRVGSETDLRLLLLAWTRSVESTGPAELEAIAAWCRDRDLRSDPSLRILLALQDGRPAGFAALYVEGAAAGIYAVSVASEFRGRRIASALVHAGVTAALNWRCRWAVATVPEGSAGPFLRRGFSEIETVSRYATDPPRPTNSPTGTGDWA